MLDDHRIGVIQVLAVLQVQPGPTTVPTLHQVLVVSPAPLEMACCPAYLHTSIIQGFGFI